LARGAKGVWEKAINEDLKGKFYAFSLEGPQMDPAREVLDVYATNAVANGSRGCITDLKETNPPDWEKAKTGPALKSPVDAIIYETHVGDFTVAPSSGAQAKGRYAGFAEAGTHLPNDAAIKTGLDHLTELGVTHVQLMPVEDFAGDGYNWGYSTTAFNSPAGIYASDPATDSRVKELKQLIATLHARGIGVILDVAYNHTAKNASFESIVPHYYYRQLPGGALTNGSGSGNEFRSEAPMAGKFIVDSLKFWATEYGVDGFRFDLMALIDTDTMKTADTELRKINPGILIYGEPWAGGQTPLKDQTNKQTIRGSPIAAFNDDFRDAIKGAPGGPAAGFIQDGSQIDMLRRGVEGSGRKWSDGPAQTVNYLTSHDGLTLADKLKASLPGGSEADVKAAMKLGYLVLFASQGVPFIQGGDEFGRTKGGNPNSGTAPVAVNQLDWTLKKTNKDVFDYARGLIALRKAHPLFRLTTKNDSETHLEHGQDPASKAVIWKIESKGLEGEKWKAACVFLNGETAPTSCIVPKGSWLTAFDATGPARDQPVSGQITIPARSGVILYQR
ncbi:MAG: type I pullulanase, partial [Verrucomicrobiota bacterium]|nr:type I pullulanase [Verrucomicrobiota bacterium]